MEESEEKPRSKKRKTPFKDRLLLLETEQHEQGRRGHDGAWAPRLPAGSPPRGFLFSALWP